MKVAWGSGCLGWVFVINIQTAPELLPEVMFNKLHLIHNSMSCLSSIPIISSALLCRYFGMWSMKGLETKAKCFLQRIVCLLSVLFKF